MKLNLDSTIEWGCNNWFQREDGIIEVFNQNNEKILLNDSIKLVWENINYSSSLKDLKRKYESDKEKKDFESIVAQLYEHKLIRILNIENEFDEIFG